MPHALQPLRERVPVTSDGTTPIDVRTDPVDPGWTWVITSYAVENETTLSTAVRAFVESGGYGYYLEEQVSPVAGVLYDGTKRLVLTEGERLGARFRGTTSGDLLRLYVIGVKVPPEVIVTPELLVALGVEPLA